MFPLVRRMFFLVTTVTTVLFIYICEGKNLLIEVPCILPTNKYNTNYRSSVLSKLGKPLHRTISEFVLAVFSEQIK